MALVAVNIIVKAHEVENLRYLAEHVFFSKLNRAQNHLLAYFIVMNRSLEKQRKWDWLVYHEMVPEFYNTFKPEVESVRQNFVLEHTEDISLVFHDFANVSRVS